MWRVWAWDKVQRLWLFQESAESLDGALAKILKWKEEGQSVRIDFVQHDDESETY